MNVSSTGMPPPAGQAFAQLDDREGARRSGSSSGGGIGGAADGAGMHGGGVQADFNSLMNLISTTIQPDSWEELSGPGSMMPYRTTLSLVIRQTQAVHDEIADLLGQLRRLQDLQVTIEVRFVTVSDNFFERIGIDFNFNLPSTVSNGLQNTFGQPLPPFGSGNPFSLLASTAGTTGGTTGGTGGAGGGTAGGTGGAAGGAAGGAGGTAGTTGSTAGSTGSGGGGPFTPGPPIDTTNYQNWPRYGAIAGLTTQNQFTSDLTVPFKQGSFSFGVPKFGGFDPNVGLNVGFAILSDIETFFLINATQGDTRNNLLFAPKVTLFNGQTATVTDTVQRPFVTSLTPTVGFFSVGFQPQITVLPEGVSMTVQAVISADRRYVRLTVIPQFTAITDVQSFSFISGSGSNPNQQANGGVGQAGGAGGTAGGGGGGGLGGFGGGFGGGGIGGTTGTTGAGGQAQGGQQQQGQQGQTATAGNAGQQITIQRPIFEIIAVATTVSVPDGGTILLGGIKRLREGRAMGGVPILNKIPYISRLFKNTGVGRETESLMLMVTPRIIIQEEEEELLGVDLPQR
jgi:type II secretory pathway component GspD/PulD (secretin)